MQDGVVACANELITGKVGPLKTVHTECTQCSVRDAEVERLQLELCHERALNEQLRTLVSEQRLMIEDLRTRYDDAADVQGRSALFCYRITTTDPSRDEAVLSPLKRFRNMRPNR